MSSLAWSKTLISLLLTSLLVGCSGLPIERVWSHNYNERVRFLVMHYTSGNYQDSLEALVDEGGLSAHYLLPQRNDLSYPEEELKIIQLVEESQRAWHAGISYWQGRRNLNDHSIGIEIVNTARCRPLPATSADNIVVRQQTSIEQLCMYPDFDPQQIQLLIALSQDILARNPDISPTQVIGHADIAPSRKNDPGPRFPWYQLYQAGVGAWYDNQTVERYWQQFVQQPPSLAVIQQGLSFYGYELEPSGEYDSDTVNTISAFQMHFLPWNVTGVADSKTVAVLFALLDKYFPGKLKALEERQKSIAAQDKPAPTGCG